ncbi:hypothetical protein D3C85_1162990 [compost metagenome]
MLFAYIERGLDPKPCERLSSVQAGNDFDFQRLPQRVLFLVEAPTMTFITEQ